MTDSGETIREKSDPLAPWKFISSLAVGAGIAFLFRRAGNCGYYGVFLFFPVKLIVDAILDNLPRHGVAGIGTLCVFPILLNSVGLLRSGVERALAGNNFDDSVFSGFTYAVFAVLLVAVMLLMSLAARLLPPWKLPDRVQAVLTVPVYLVVLVVALVALGRLLEYCDGRLLRYPRGAHVVIRLILTAIGVAAAFRIVRMVFHPPKERSERNEKAEGLRMSERPDVRLDDVAGMEEVKEQLRLRLIEPVRHPDRAKKYGLGTGGGVLLYGPPGTGKTFLARAVAGELDLPFYMITAADVFGKYVGESEQNIRELFRSARQNPLSVVFVDEMETIFGKRTEEIHETTQKVISVILQELDGVDQNKNPILLLGATNTPWKIDEAFLRPGRFDILAFVGLPDTAARRQILQLAFRKATLALEPGLIDYIAENTRGYSGADLNGLVVKIQQQAFRNRAESFSRMLAYEIMLKNRPASCREILHRIREWERTRR